MGKNGKKILVTGSAGFVGSHLVDHLLAEGHSVFGVDDLNICGGSLRNVNRKSVFTKLDLRKKKPAEKYISKLKPEIIFHLAADATEGRSQFTPIECTERNYQAYLNVLVPAIKNGLKRIVLASSMSVYGAQKPPFDEEMATAPEDIYAISKAAMEKATEILAGVYRFEYAIIRPHNVYGTRQNMADPYRNVIAIFINRLLNKKNFFIYGDGKQERSYTYISDFVEPFARCGFISEAKNQIFNIGPEEKTSINELARMILEEFFGTKKCDKSFSPVYLAGRPKEVKFAYCTSRKAKRILGYSAKTSLKDGLKEMVKWAKATGYQKPKYLKKLELYSENVPETWKKKLI